jgi:F1F0 ATPase subunit 2
MQSFYEVFLSSFGIYLWALCFGVLLGGLFFGGLWFSVKRLALVKQPALLFFAGFLIRLGIVLYGLYWIGDGQWQRLLACLLGFWVARMLIRVVLFWFSETSALADIISLTALNSNFLKAIPNRKESINGSGSAGRFGDDSVKDITGAS